MRMPCLILYTAFEVLQNPGCFSRQVFVLCRRFVDDIAAVCGLRGMTLRPLGSGVVQHPRGHDLFQRLSVRAIIFSRRAILDITVLTICRCMLAVGFSAAYRMASS